MEQLDGSHAMAEIPIRQATVPWRGMGGLEWSRPTCTSAWVARGLLLLQHSCGCFLCCPEVTATAAVSQPLVCTDSSGSKAFSRSAGYALPPAAMVHGSYPEVKMRSIS